jgi:hypothetical protein
MMLGGDSRALKNTIEHVYTIGLKKQSWAPAENFAGGGKNVTMVTVEFFSDKSMKNTALKIKNTGIFFKELS